MPTCSTTEDAASILQGDFLSPDLIQSKLDMEYSSDHIALLENTLPNAYKLKQSREQGVMLVAGPNRRLNIGDIFKLDPHSFGGTDAAKWGKVDGLHLTDVYVNPGWMLFRKEPIAESGKMTWQDMSRLIVGKQIVPNVAEAMWAIIAFKAAHGKFLFSEDHVRTSTSPRIGEHLAIGNCGADNRPTVMKFKDSEKFYFLKLTYAQKEFSR